MLPDTILTDLGLGTGAIPQQNTTYRDYLQQNSSMTEVLVVDPHR